MKKGVAVQTLVQIVLAVLVITAGGYFIMGPGRVYFMGVLEYLKNLLGLGSINKDISHNLKMAVLCSHYRCKYGCESNEVEKIKWVENGEVVNCIDYCKLTDYMEDKNKLRIDGKMVDRKKTVCDENSFNYPVEFENRENNLIITHSEWDYFDCILPTEENARQGNLADEVNLVSVNSEVLGEIISQTESCEISKTAARAGIVTDEAYEKFSIKTGKVYLYSTFEDEAGSDINYTTYITSEPRYIIIEPDKSKTFEVIHDQKSTGDQDAKINRIVVKKDDFILESAILTYGYYIAYPNSPTVEFKFKCPGSSDFSSDKLSISLGHEDKLCSGTFEFVLNNEPEIIGTKSIIHKFKIKYLDKECYPITDQTECENSGCRPCRVESRDEDGKYAWEFVSCCYQGQPTSDCNQCKSSEPEKVRYWCGSITNQKECEKNPVCEVCTYVDLDSWEEDLTVCCVKGRCNYWSGCKELNPGDECEGIGDSGCPDTAPCTEKDGEWFCLESRPKCKSPNRCDSYCPSGRKLDGYSCEEDRFCCRPETGMIINPPFPMFGESFAVKYVSETAYINVYLLVKYPDGDIKYKPVDSDDIESKDGFYSWSWTIGKDSSDNFVYSDDQMGEYDIEVWVNVKDGNPNGSGSEEIPEGGKATVDLSGMG